MKQLFLFGLLIFLSACTKSTERNPNVLRDSVFANIKGLDPAQVEDIYSAKVVHQIYETLLHYDPIKRPLELEPLLLESLPTVSKDGLTHTFKLRKGIRFQNHEAFHEGKGRELIAQDIVYSWLRLCDPTIKTSGFWIFDGKIKGLNEWREQRQKGFADYLTPVEGLDVTDPYTLVVKLTKPYYQFHHLLTMHYTAIVPREAVQKLGPDFMSQPVGTGPFVLKKWTRNSQVVLDKNKNYWSKELAPHIDQLIIREITEDQPRWLEFLKGDLDLALIPKDNFDSSVKDGALLPELKDKGIHLIISDDMDILYFGFNMLDPILGKNKNLRKAMALGHDSKLAISKFLNNRAVLAQTVVPPNTQGEDKQFVNPLHAYNVQQAKELLKKAGYPEGKGLPEIELSVGANPTYRQMAEMFQQEMAAIGIKIRISIFSFPQFVERLKTKKNQMWLVAWRGDFPEASNFYSLLISANESPGPNYVNFKNADYDKNYLQAQTIAPGAGRKKYYDTLNKITIEESPMILEGHRLSYTVYHPWVKNLYVHGMIYDYYRYVQLDLAKKK